MKKKTLHDDMIEFIRTVANDRIPAVDLATMADALLTRHAQTLWKREQIIKEGEYHDILTTNR